VAHFTLAPAGRVLGSLARVPKLPLRIAKTPAGGGSLPRPRALVPARMADPGSASDPARATDEASFAAQSDGREACGEAAEPAPAGGPAGRAECAEVVAGDCGWLVEGGAAAEPIGAGEAVWPSGARGAGADGAEAGLENEGGPRGSGAADDHEALVCPRAHLTPHVPPRAPPRRGAASARAGGRPPPYKADTSRPSLRTNWTLEDFCAGERAGHEAEGAQVLGCVAAVLCEERSGSASTGRSASASPPPEEEDAEAAGEEGGGRAGGAGTGEAARRKRRSKRRK